MTQNAHEKLQPSWIFTNARTSVEARVGLYAADRTDVAGDERRRLLAPAAQTIDVLGQAVERVAPRFAAQPVT